MSTLHVHCLDGCASTPLAHYLKALAVLRLIAEQADPEVRGWWRGDRFHLLTHLDRDGIAEFFLARYAPTPLITPWNGGSGFYPKDNKEGLAAIRGSFARRLEVYRQAIADAQAMTHRYEEAPKKEEKAAFVQRCRERWRGPLAAWLDAALVLGADGDPSYPALLGTGGNDGRLDFTNNFMRRLAELLDMASPQAAARPEAALLLEGALWGASTPGLIGGAIGQFMPGGAGGANQGEGFSGDPLFNPWDFVLMLEGTIVFRASLVRRAESQALPQAAAPFAFRGSAIGYGSAADADESARGEQWMPIWSAPTTYAEVSQLFAEGRSKLGERTARRPLEFARAIARLGVARGIDSFERFGYIERNGQANLAVPLGRWVVQAQPHQDLLDDVAGWVDSLRAAGRVAHAPASLRSAGRSCEEAMLACCRQGSAIYWQELLLRLAEAEQVIVRSPKFAKERDLRPLPRLSIGWIDAAAEGLGDDRRARAFRLALALASLYGPEVGQGEGERRPQWNDPIRRHWIPIDLDSKGAYKHPRYRMTSDAIDRPHEVVASGHDLRRDAVLVLRRRAIHRGVHRTLGLMPAVGWATASLADVGAFIHGEVDEARCLGLALALMAIDWKTIREHNLRPDRPLARGGAASSMALYGLLRLATPFGEVRAMPIKARDMATNSLTTREAPAISVALDPAVLERLLADDLGGAFRAASDRLRIAGLRPRMTVAAAAPESLRRLAAGLIFPIADLDHHHLAERLTKPTPADDDPDSADSTSPEGQVLRDMSIDSTITVTETH